MHDGLPGTHSRDIVPRGLWTRGRSFLLGLARACPAGKPGAWGSHISSWSPSLGASPSPGGKTRRTWPGKIFPNSSVQVERNFTDLGKCPAHLKDVEGSIGEKKIVLAQGHTAIPWLQES